MHLSIVCTLALFFCVMGAEGTRCNTACTREYRPVCGHLQSHDDKIIRCTFANSCLLHVRNCLTNENWLKQAGRCRVDSIRCRKILGNI